MTDRIKSVTCRLCGNDLTRSYAMFGYDCKVWHRDAHQKDIHSDMLVLLKDVSFGRGTKASLAKRAEKILSQLEDLNTDLFIIEKENA